MSACPVADAQTDKERRFRDSKDNRDLIVQWNDIAERLEGSAPWDQLVDDLSAALIDAGSTQNSNDIESYLRGMKAAEEDAGHLPENRIGAAPEALVQLLIESRIMSSTQKDYWVIRNPLYARNREGGYVLIWDYLFAQPEIAATDPAIRAYKRGAEMIDPLIDALGDMTLTRSVQLQMASTRPSIALRRCDLAMALLEAITHCKFVPLDRQEFFSEKPLDARTAIIASVKEWREATRGQGRAEAMEWWFQRADVLQAEPMIYALLSENDTARALSHLRRYVDTTEVSRRSRIVDLLARLGDDTGLRYLARQLQEKKTLERADLSKFMEHGSRAEFQALHDIILEEIESGSDQGSLSRVFLEILGREAHTPETYLALPTLVALLEVDDELSGEVILNFQNSQMVSRADLAAYLIQVLTGIDFRWEREADPATRQKAMDRIKDWWADEGRGVYGFYGIRAGERPRIP